MVELTPFRMPAKASCRSIEPDPLGETGRRRGDVAGDLVNASPQPARDGVSVASEKVGRERRKTARNGPSSPVLMVRNICQEWPHSAGFRPMIRSGKRMSRLGVLAEGSSLAANILCAPGDR